MAKTPTERIIEMLTVLAAFEARLGYCDERVADLARDHKEGGQSISERCKQYELDLSHLKRDIEELKKWKAALEEEQKDTKKWQKGVRKGVRVSEKVSGPFFFLTEEDHAGSLAEMGRPLRTSLGEYVYHALNRGNGRATIFHKDGDYAAFLRVLIKTQEHVPGMRLLSYCLMPNHWHLVLWPREDGELSDFMHWLTLTHTQRWHAHYHDVGSGHLYQGRFKSFPVEGDEHYLTLCRYVERNALRAGLVSQAEVWRWGSLAQRLGHGVEPGPKLEEGPLLWPQEWANLVNEVQTEGELAALRRCVERGQPYGSDAWVRQAAVRLGLESTLKPRGRPKKPLEKGS